MPRNSGQGQNIRVKVGNDGRRKPWMGKSQTFFFVVDCCPLFVWLGLKLEIPFLSFQIITTIATIMAVAVAVLTPEAAIGVTTHEGEAGPHKTESGERIRTRSTSPSPRTAEEASKSGWAVATETEEAPRARLSISSPLAKTTKTWAEDSIAIRLERRGQTCKFFSLVPIFFVF